MLRIKILVPYDHRVTLCPQNVEKNLVCMEENVQKDGTVSFVIAQKQVLLVQLVAEVRFFFCRYNIVR